MLSLRPIMLANAYKSTLLTCSTCSFHEMKLLGKRRYNIKLWKTFTDVFNCLPVAAIVDEKIFAMHGGLSPDLLNMEQIRRVMRPTDIPDTGSFSLKNVNLIVTISKAGRSDSTTLLFYFLRRFALRSLVVRSRQGDHWMERERSWCVFHLWPRCCQPVPPEARPRLDLPCPPGC